MANKKFRKLKSSDINRNSGKEISHTINKIKEHELRYTIILVVIFMIAIVAIGYFVFKVDYEFDYDLINLTDTPAISLYSDTIRLNNDSIMSDALGLKSNEYKVKYTNNTGDDIDFLMRIAYDEKSIVECSCADSVVSYDKLRYSINDGPAMSFDNEDMIIYTDTIDAKKTVTFSIKVWIDEEVSNTRENLFFGKVLFEQVEDMNKD